MNTILVPTDYSASAKNAALYAIHLASQLKAQKIILYNAFQPPPVITENTAMPTATAPFFDIESLRDMSSTGMTHFKKSIEGFCPSELKLEQLTEFAALDTNINNLCKKTGADLIIMGITGTSKIEEVLIGSTALSVVKNTKTPVIVVPAEVTFTPIENVMLACDFTKVAETTPVQPIKNILDATKAALYVVNIYSSDKEITSVKSYEQELLHSLLREYNPNFHFEYKEDFITGINDCVEEKNINLIITIPKKHGFLEGLFKERHIKKLAFHSHVPVMYVHQEDL
ncbi:universal stress protein [Segetibacter koreensis]|uniref:universal stress protein n=1 Tax=Segetibacter koreensis TaxID=398037 RepID=UPI000376BAEF|nr:universal stress protein [Segetibacter koreensis]